MPRCRPTLASFFAFARSPFAWFDVPKRVLLPSALFSALLLVAAAPADSIPAPRSERCIVFNPDPAEGEMATPAGLSYEQVRAGLNGVIQYALKCGQPSGFQSLHLTFELQIGCNGVVSTIAATDDDGAPAAYVACVAAVIKKADFPAHDMADGFPVTYPVNVAW